MVFLSFFPLEVMFLNVQVYNTLSTVQLLFGLIVVFFCCFSFVCLVWFCLCGLGFFVLNLKL